MFNKAEQKIALEIAKKSIELAFNPAIDALIKNLPEIFKEKQGVFVSLYKNGKLKGCIGNFLSDIILADNIKEMAYEAAFNDPRFSPLEKKEFKNIEIEVSVLSPMQKIKNISEIKIGEHGVYLKNGSKSGVYLPQVATELGWSKEQMLESLCSHKAGMENDCYLNPLTEIYTFTAQIIKEKNG